MLDGPELDAEALRSMAGLYRTLAELRRAHRRGDPAPDKAFLQSLTAAFPGALRELDTVQLRVFVEREQSLEQAARALDAGSDRFVTDWMRWMHAYHQWMRVALWLKRRLRKSTSPRDSVALAKEASQFAGFLVHENFVEAVANAENGRRNPVVFRFAAHGCRTTAEILEAALFPGRSSGPDEGE